MADSNAIDQAMPEARFRYRSQVDDDSQQISLHWGALNTIFAQWLKSNNWPLPGWIQQELSFPAWITFIIDTNPEDQVVLIKDVICDADTPDAHAGHVLSALFAQTFEPFFANKDPKEELLFLNYILSHARIEYQDTAPTPYERSLRHLKRMGNLIIDKRRIASDERVCPPSTLSFNSSDERHLIIPWNLFHAFIAVHLPEEEEDDVEEQEAESQAPKEEGQEVASNPTSSSSPSTTSLVPYLTTQLTRQARLDIHYAANPYSLDHGDHTHDHENPSRLLKEVEVSHPEANVAKEVLEEWQSKTKPYLDRRVHYIDTSSSEEADFWRDREPFKVDEKGTVWRSRFWGLITAIEYLMMQDKGSEAGLK